jgi:hypothetical protein
VEVVLLESCLFLSQQTSYRNFWLESSILVSLQECQTQIVTKVIAMFIMRSRIYSLQRASSLRGNSPPLQTSGIIFFILFYGGTLFESLLFYLLGHVLSSDGHLLYYITEIILHM